MNHKTSPSQLAPPRRPKPTHACAFIACAALAFALFTPTGRAEAPPQLQSFSGQYKYTGTKEQGIAIVEKALDDGLSDLNMVMRLLVKKTMSSHFVEAITIEIRNNKIGIKTGELAMAATEDGKAESFTSADGKHTMKVTHHFDGAKVIETSVGEMGTTTTVYELTGDGKTLQRNVSFKSERLQKPIRYKLSYTRK